jgi:methionyl-tRNA synthetase
MKIVTFDDARFEQAFGIDVASIGAIPVSAPDAGSRAAFSAGFGRIAPGGETAPHRHDEAEAFFILSGEGDAIGADGPRRVRPGSFVLFEPFEEHILRNVGDEELCFLDLYWRDRELAAAAAREQEQRAGPTFVFSAPPTPNGDLHIGHLSGPYLAADVLVRYLRMTGAETYHITSSDDYQHSVVEQARKEGKTEAEVALGYTDAIRATLEAMDVIIDQFTIPVTDETYADGVRDFFSRIVASGALRRREAPALFDGDSGDYLYDVALRGLCPACGAGAMGGICEECGEPNLGVDLVEPQALHSATPPRRATADRYSLALAEHRDIVFQHHRANKVSPRVQDLATRVFERDELDFPVTHPSRWGIPPAEETNGRQVIWVWLEMPYVFLHGIAELGRRLGRGWSAKRPQDDWKFVSFFGFDNSFFQTILYPVLFRLAHPDWRLSLDWNVNEFYLLDGAKFSTSRRHAIWGKELLSPATVDSVRFYLALTRSETRRTNFELRACQERVETLLIGKWQAWLADLGERIARGFEGRAPDAGSWAPTQRAFLGLLQTRLDAMAGHYSAEGQSLNAAARELDLLVDDAIRFRESHRQLASVPAAHGEWRTAIALELAAARLLAMAAAPLMPRFAAALANALGLAPAREWDRSVGLVPPDSKIELAGADFFAVPRVPAENEPGFGGDASQGHREEARHADAV